MLTKQILWFLTHVSSTPISWLHEFKSQEAFENQEPSNIFEIFKNQDISKASEIFENQAVSKVFKSFDNQEASENEYHGDILEEDTKDVLWTPI